MRTLFLTLLLIILKSLPVISQPKYEIRATWLTTLRGMDWPRTKAGSATGIQRQKKELCDILDRLKAANFNTVLLQSRLRGDMIYPSSIETFAESLTGYTGRNPGYDPLAFAIEECHKRGMELHAWIVTIPAGNTRQVKLLGRNSIVQRNRKICKLYKGNWYLDPGNPETKEYLSRIVKEITSQYKFPDKDTYRRYGKGKELKQWRRDNITDIVRRLYTDIKSIKPWVKVSSSPIGKYRDTNRYPSRGWNAYHVVYQDAQRWLKEGIHDALKTNAVKAGLKPLRIHAFRHAHAAYLIEMQVPILAISNRLGHEKIQTTMNTYGHLYPNKQRQIADAIEARVKGEF